MAGTNGTPFLLPEIAPMQISPEVQEQLNKIDAAARTLIAAIAELHTLIPNVGTKPHPIKARLARFDERHKQRFGVPAKIEGGRDSKIVKDLIAKYGEEKVDELIDEFFKCEDDWVVKRGFTLNVFSGQVPGMISKNGTPRRLHGVTRNTAANRENAQAGADLIRSTYAR